MSDVIALAFDFDDTLTDDSTTQLLRKAGVNADQFWGEKVAGRIADGWDPTLAFVQEFLALTKAGQPLAGLNSQKLNDFGRTLTFYPGLPDIFADLRTIAAEFRLTQPRIEVYVISGGFEDIIRGSSLAKELTAFWGVACAADETDTIAHPKRVVDFTTKTRYLFEINKGLAHEGRKNPFLVNESIPEERRRVPFENIIYCGDGLTDVAAFSVVQSRGGMTFGLFDPKNRNGLRRSWEKFLKPHRVGNMCSPRYRADDDLGALLRMAVLSICERLEAIARIPDGKQ